MGPWLGGARDPSSLRRCAVLGCLLRTLCRSSLRFAPSCIQPACRRGVTVTDQDTGGRSLSCQGCTCFSVFWRRLSRAQTPLLQ